MEYLNADTPYTEKYVKMKLESHFGEDIILIGVKAKWNVVTSSSTGTAFKIYQRKRQGENETYK